MLFKILWDIHSKKSNLWIKWIHAYYHRGRDVWLWFHSKDDHPLFKKLQLLRDKLITDTGSLHHAKQKLNSWNKNGKFCTSLVYDWMRIKIDKKPWMSLIWRSYIAPKFSFILWLAMRGKLNTKDHWLVEAQDNKCDFCKTVPETISHLYFNCSFVKAIWYLSFVKRIKKDLGGAYIHSKAVTLAFAATVYTVWISRNRILFSGGSITTLEIVKMIKTLVMSIIHVISPSDNVCLLFSS